MDLFDIPLLKPAKHLGDCLIDEPSSPSNCESEDPIETFNYTENLSQSFSNIGNDEKVLKTEEFKLENLGKCLNSMEDSEFKQDETSKIANFSEFSKNFESYSDRNLQFIEYAEFNVQKVKKVHDFDDTRYEIEKIPSQLVNTSENNPDISLSLLQKSSKSPIRSESPTIKQQSMPKVLESNKRLKLTSQSLNKSNVNTSNTDRKELNFTVPLIIAPESKTSPRGLNSESRLSSDRSFFPYFQPKSDQELLEDDRITAKKRLLYIELELEKAFQKISYLKNELVQNEKSNFIERSQKISEIHYTEMQLEVFDLKNVSIIQESLQKENNSLRKEYERLLKTSRNPGKTVKKPSIVKNIPNTENSETLKAVPTNTLVEQKDKVEWELRKLGITSQRKAILRTRLQELTIQLENQKEKPRLPLFI